MKLPALASVILAISASSAQAAVPGWQLAATPQRCLSFNVLADGPPLQIGLLHQQGGPWSTVIGTDATARLTEGAALTLRFEYQNGFARREYAATVARLGRSIVVLLPATAQGFARFDPADISPPQALLLVEEVGKPFTLTDTATGTVVASGKVPPRFGAAFTEFLSCARGLDNPQAVPPR